VKYSLHLKCKTHGKLILAEALSGKDRELRESSARQVIVLATERLRYCYCSIQEKRRPETSKAMTLSPIGQEEAVGREVVAL
jgi:hypothetical protein